MSSRWSASGSDSRLVFFSCKAFTCPFISLSAFKYGLVSSYTMSSPYFTYIGARCCILQPLRSAQSWFAMCLLKKVYLPIFILQLTRGCSVITCNKKANTLKPIYAENTRWEEFLWNIMLLTSLGPIFIGNFLAKAEHLIWIARAPYWAGNNW